MKIIVISDLIRKDVIFVLISMVCPRKHLLSYIASSEHITIKNLRKMTNNTIKGTEYSNLFNMNLFFKRTSCLTASWTILFWVDRAAQIYTNFLYKSIKLIYYPCFKHLGTISIFWWITRMFMDVGKQHCINFRNRTITMVSFSFLIHFLSFCRPMFKS